VRVTLLSQPVSLVMHDGELSDVCALLSHLGVRFVERFGASTEEDEVRVWELVISTPRRLLEFDPGASGTQPARIAILDKDSHTLRSMLHRAGIDLLVRRPVHPDALRMLVLYALYRGPEKRRSLRVSIGARVHCRSGLRRYTAVLADLSSTGCRLLSNHPAEKGGKLRIRIPAAVAAGRALSVSGRVVRIGPSQLPGVRTVAVSWGRQTGGHGERLRALVAAFGQGPASLSPDDAEVQPRREASDTEPTPEVTLDAPPDPERESARERRASPRHEYSQHVIALGVEAARVLLGRDISLGGMRVEPHPDMHLGDELSIALHVRAREKPLIVKAGVARDEGEQGLVLQFLDLSEEHRSYLKRMVDYLPVLAHREGSEEAVGVVVSEIIEHKAATAG
jgi:hypothetical protein